MIHPSYVELMRVVNDSAVEIGEEPVVNSRYSIVTATAKRARQIIDGNDPLIETKHGDKPLSTAVTELYNGNLRILSDEEAAEAEALQEAAKKALEEARANAEDGSDDDTFDMDTEEY
ncbi:MAG: DNA-directed RNA polymerase subunit omega [Lachnospiraceae bacterium]|nr:DNA-directed RNA polymerase subunit omega [Lachnospiraceae bacterium]